MRIFISSLILILISNVTTYASHILGGDLLYTHINGNTYQVKLTLYGDCSGSAFSLLSNSSPKVKLYNGATLNRTLTLTRNGNGVNVTPVCPQFANNTQCTNPNSTIPGVTRYIFTTNVNIPSASTNWRFRFEGDLNNHQAGRSNSITNIVIGTSGSIMTLEAVLNNQNFPNNSSPDYTTVPTPFFCINQATSFNPGAVDPNSDSLSFALINALEGTGTVTYNTGYTGSNPVSATGVTFNNTNGQYSFTPNIVQTSVVVNEVKEYRNGILVGSSMREMNFIVQNNCNNSPPNGTISAPNGGTVVTPTFFRTCPAPNTIQFAINPTDANGDTINVSYSGIPPGATANVSNNNTPNPTFNFNWNLLSATPGTVYTIFLTYTDYGCPLSAKQTIAYNIYVLPRPDFHYIVTQDPSCVSRTHFTLNPYRNQAPYNITIDSNMTNFRNYSSLTGAVMDSLYPGTYQINMVDNFGCIRDTNLFIAPPPDIKATVSNINEPQCFGDSTGTFTITASNGKPPYGYSLNGGAYSANNIFTNLTGGNYVVSIIDSNYCTFDTQIVLNQPQEILLNTTFTKPPCNNYQNGSITVSAYNSVAPYTYAFNGGVFGTVTTYNNLYSGTYPITVKNAIGCEKEFNIILPDSIKIDASITMTDILCYGDTSALVTINAVSGYPPYSYSKDNDPPQTSNVIGPLSAGSYTLHVTDTDGCYWDSLIQVMQPDSFTLSTTQIEPLCWYSADGSITVTATGATAPYLYSADGSAPQTSSTLIGLTDGVHTISVTDANNCLKEIQVELFAPDSINMQVAIDSTTCPGSPDGSISISASGGIAPYSYSIGGPFQSSGVFSSLSSGTYTVSVMDANNCQKDSIIQIFDPKIELSAFVQDPLCYGDTSGYIVILAMGGKAPYTYALNFSGPYQVNDTFPNLSSGTYTVYVKDSNNCIKDTMLDINDPDSIAISTTLKQPPCNSFQNGEIDVLASNSVGPYMYSLDGSPFSTSGLFTGLFSGPYTITVQNGLGCTRDFPIELPDSIKIEATLNIVDNPCFSDSVASVMINAVSGYPSYTYFKDMDPPQTSNVISNLKSGSYDIHVRDTKNCYWDTTITINQPDSIQIIDSSIRISCLGANDGVVYFSTLGGTPPFQFSVNGGVLQVSNQFTGLSGGWHSVSVQDANYCTNQDSFFIFEPPALEINYTIDTPSCFGVADGVITATGIGGSIPYEYALDTGPWQSSGIFSNLGPGTYTLHLRDSSLCSLDTTITITQPDSMSIHSEIRNSLCETLGDGVVTLHVSGGSPNFSYSINGGGLQVDSTFTNVAAGNHLFTVIDRRGCVKDTNITLVDSFNLSANLSSSNTLCNASGGGWIKIEGLGGNAPYLYGINGTGYSTIDSFTNLFAGTHNLTLKDTFGCIFDTTLNLQQPSNLNILASFTNALCFDSNSGEISLIGLGGTPPYTFSVDGGMNFQSNPVFSNLGANSYQAVVMDANGCTKDTVLVLQQPTPVQFTVDLVDNKCNGDNTGLITITPSQGTSPYTYSLDGGAAQSNNSFSSNAGSHTVTVIDANGCMMDTLILLNQPPPIHFDVRITDVTCFGNKDGEVHVEGRGGANKYRYGIDGGALQSHGLFQNLSVGNYVLNIVDSNGCSKDSLVSVASLPRLTYQNLDINGESCYGYKDGTINVLCNGTGPFTYYLRNFNDTTTSGYFDSLETGWYTLTTIDANGCLLDTNFFVPIPEPFEISLETTLNDCNMAGNESAIKVLPSGGTSPFTFVWSNGQSNVDMISDLANGFYSVYAHDKNGCSDSAQVEITFDNCCNTFIPNAFTPNQDGDNDHFGIQFNGDVELRFFEIYNRWGKKIWEAEDLSDTWDGTLYGRDVDIGVYHYRIRYICGNIGKVIDESGDITLIR